MLQTGQISKNECPPQTISLDSAASEHVTNDRSLLRNVIKVDVFRIEIADGREVESYEKGEMLIKMKNAEEKCIGTLLLRNVYYLEHIELSLMSVAKLDEQGIISVFSMGAVKLLDRYKNNGLLGIGKCNKNGLFQFYTECFYTKIYSLQNKAESMRIWHIRMDHASPEIVNAMENSRKYGMELQSMRVEHDCSVCNEAKLIKSASNGELV